jgi:uncharacterized protein YjdB/spore germination protein YaaH
VFKRLIAIGLVGIGMLISTNSLVKGQDLASVQTGKVTMAWNYVSESSLDRMSNLDIISPNWFVMDQALNISDQGSLSYVKDAHSRGLKVQPRLEGPMTTSWGAAAILNDPLQRKTIIDNLLNLINQYKNNGSSLDGINLDFEGIGPDSTKGYTQFVKELAPVLKAQGLQVSIDVPGLTNYNRDGVWSGGFDFVALAQIPELDYIIIMAYDWTYGAPKGYVRDALSYAVERIPKNKILLGVPLYSQDYISNPQGFTSPWGQISPYSTYYYKNAITAINAPEANHQSVWMDDFGITRTSYLKNGTQHIMFLEDSKSLGVKLDLVNEFNIAGMAAWRLKDEDPAIYQVIGEKMGKDPTPSSFGINYQAHVQNVGWQPWTYDGAIAGTQGQALRVEALKLSLKNAPPGARIKYQVHVQNIGWMDWTYDGQIAGTMGKSLRIEAFRAQLENAPGYTVEYQAHVQNIGWMNWVRDGQIAGTSGNSLRVEALRLRVVEQTDPQTLSIAYQGHVESIGWQNWVRNGEMAGTQGKALRVEGIRIMLENPPPGMRLKYKTHVQNIGWQDWVYDGNLAGTEGHSLRLEAICIATENTPPGYKLQYRVHVQNLGWQDWKTEGQIAGTSGQSLRLEAVEVKLVKQ